MWALATLLPVFGIFVAGTRPARRRRVRKYLLLGGALLLMVFMAACGSGSKNAFAEAPQTTNITITAAGPNGTPSQSATISVTVTPR
jgi:hypothetical protein